MLVLIGAVPEGRKEFAGFQIGSARESLRLGFNDKAGRARAAIYQILTLTSQLCLANGATMKINLLFDAQAQAAPQIFRDTIQAAADVLGTTFEDAITANISVGYGEIQGQPVPSHSAVGGPVNGESVAYPTLYNLLSASVSPDVRSGVAALPTGSSVQGLSQIVVWPAEEKALGLKSATDASLDGVTGFATDIPSNSLEIVAMHELTHALGRVTFGSGTQADIQDLFRFSSGGIRPFGNAYSGVAASYFSLDGGATDLGDYSSDPGDFDNNTGRTPSDPFNAVINAAVAQSLTMVDILQMEVLGFHASSHRPSVAHDFGDDGHADIVYRQNSSGNTVLAQLNGSHAAAPSAFTDVQLGLDWSVVSTASDFNNDGHGDILFRNVASGATILSEMNGAHQAAPSAFTDVQVNNSFAIAGTDDFNGDGYADILYRNVASGQTLLSEMSGPHQAAPSAFTDVQLDNSFAVAGTGDFNGDGKADILYRKASSGSTLIAFQDGSHQAAPSAFTDVQVGNDYKVWVADFDGDGKSDLLFRNVNTGQTAVALMNGSHQKAPTAFTDVQLNNQFEIAQVSDFNGDGTADILFRNATSGSTLVAFMNGAHQAAPSAFTDVQVDHSWAIV